MNKKILELGLYGVLGLAMLIFAIFGLGIALNLDFAVNLERSIVRDLGLIEFDLLLVSQIGLVVATSILIAILVYLDEKVIRKNLKRG
jgi:hypothetical protein